GRSRADGRAAGGARGPGGGRGAWLRRRHRGGDAACTRVTAGCVAARSDCAAGHGAVVGLAFGPQLRHARRREGDGPPDPAASGVASAGGRTRGRQPRRRSRGHTRGRAGAALVILTGRAGLIALICVLPITVSPWPATTFAVLL